MTGVLANSRHEFHQSLIQSLLYTTSSGHPSNADSNNRLSIAIAAGIAAQLGNDRVAEKKSAQTAGNEFEEAVLRFVLSTFPKLPMLRPGRWTVERMGARQSLSIAKFEQYAHLLALHDLALKNKELAAALGSDYTIAPDIVIARAPEDDQMINATAQIVDMETARRSPIRVANSNLPMLHATISCKWTIRSDRAQNSRSEGLNLVKNRKGRLPHVAVVTAEPLPSRLASIALGTGEIDCVYHVALPELIAAVTEFGHEDAVEMLQIMTDGRRLRDIADLPLDLTV